MTRRTIALLLIVGILVIGCGGPIEESSVDRPFFYSGVVPVRTIDGGGSGFVIRDEGANYLIVTAAHVVDMEDTVMVLGIESEVVAVDYETDITIIRTPKFDQNWRIWSMSDARIEDKCRIAGFIYVNGMDNPLFAVYWGRVTTVNWSGLISFNGGAYPGLSGGPLINEKGEVIAVCSGCMGAWGLPMETATVFSPIENVEALLETIDNEVVTSQPSGD